jgi:hypothetical protein
MPTPPEGMDFRGDDADYPETWTERTRAAAISARAPRSSEAVPVHSVRKAHSLRPVPPSTTGNRNGTGTLNRDSLTDEKFHGPSLAPKRLLGEVARRILDRDVV